MHHDCLQQWTQRHDFRCSAATGERRTIIVFVLTLIVMVVEIVAGMTYGSMALLADGWHMSTHAAAFAITIFAYVYARRHTADPRFSFGPAKVGALGGFTSAILLIVVALAMAWESVQRILHPQPIAFSHAILVAFIGLLFNLLSAWLLGHEHHHGHDHGHDHHGHAPGHDNQHGDLNLRAAYLHVLADALTSVFAIGALLGGRHFGWQWLDAAVGIVGALVITKWAVGLMRDTSRVLLDREMDLGVVTEIREAIESDGDSRIADLHVQRVGINQFAVVATVVAHADRTPNDYKDRLRIHDELVHFNIEVNRCPGA